MARVVVVGGANVDIKGRSAGPLISGTSNPGAVTASPGGVARNIAENLARLGLEVSLISVLGHDANGELLRNSCVAHNVDITWTVTGDHPTGTYLAILDDRGEMVNAVNDMRGIATLSPAHLQRAGQELSRADMIVADCNIDGPCLEWLSRFARTRGKRLLIEPVSVSKSSKILQLSEPSSVFAITPNIQQLESLSGESDIGAALAKLHSGGFRNVVVHRGPRGAVASTGREAVEVPPSVATPIADVTGAGDAAVAGLVLGLTGGLDIAEAARLGQAAAAVKLMSGDSVSSQLTRDRLTQIAERNRTRRGI